MHKGTLYQITYVAGKARSMDAAEILRKRTQVTLDRLGDGQIARIHKISNGFGTYGYRVNVVTEVLKTQ